MNKAYAVINNDGSVQVTLDEQSWRNCADQLILQRLSKEILRLGNYINRNKKHYTHYKRPDAYRKSETIKKIEYLLTIYYGKKVEVKL